MYFSSLPKIKRDCNACLQISWKFKEYVCGKKDARAGPVSKVIYQAITERYQDIGVA
jgi:hypothetical protein